MNPLDFIDCLDYAMGLDVLYPESMQFSEKKRNISSFTPPNNFHVVYKHVSDSYGSVFKDKNIGIINYFKDGVLNSDLEYFMKDHLVEHYVFYILLILFVGDSNLRNTSVGYMIFQSDYKKTEETRLKHLQVFTKSAESLIQQMHDEIKAFLSSKDPFMEAKIHRFYYSTVNFLLDIYTELYNVYERNNQLSIKSLGLTPTYWPTSFKMRLRAICELKHYKLILAHIGFVKPYFPSLKHAQRTDALVPLTPTLMLHYMEFLPEIPLDFIRPKDELDSFVGKLYTPDLKFIRPTTARDVLLRYFVVCLPRWETVWRKCKWPMNRRLYYNIIQFRMSYEIPNTTLWKRVLFFRNI